jgi:hypothetical protein
LDNLLYFLPKMLQNFDCHVGGDSQSSHECQCPGRLRQWFDGVNKRVHNPGSCEAPEEHLGAVIFGTRQNVQERNEQEGWNVLQVIQVSPANNNEANVQI